MRLPRPIQLSAAIALVAVGFVGPWQLGMLRTEVEAPRTHVEALERPPVVFTLPALDGPEDIEGAAPPEELEEPPSKVAEAPAPEPTPKAEPAEVSADPLQGRPDGLKLVAVAPNGQRVAGDPKGRPNGQGERSARPPTRPKDQRPRTRTCEPDREDIAKVHDTGYRVDIALIDYYADHPREAEELAATWWADDDEGAHEGFKVGRIRCGSILHQAGFRSGDVILAVNSFEIQSYRDAITAFLQLRHKDVLWVEVERRGEPLRLDYQLVSADQVQTEDPQDPTALVDEALASPDLLVRLDNLQDRRQERVEGRRDNRTERREGREERRSERRGENAQADAE